MIGQQIGLDYLIPLALEVLANDLFAEGDFFKGDLLKNVLSIKIEFWDNNKNYWVTLDVKMSLRQVGLTVTSHQRLTKENMKKVIAAMNMTLEGFCDHTSGVPDEEIHQHYAGLLRTADTTQTNNSIILLT